MDARFSYRQTAVQGATPVRLVICLYEQAIEDLRRALTALETRDYEGRTRAINHALTVIGQLQGTLNMEVGGQVAQNLDRFYHILRSGLIEAQGNQSAKLMREQIAHLALVHEAWLEVERSMISPSASSTQETAEPETPAHFLITDQTSFSDWSA